MERRKVDIVVISDVHLGTYGSRAFELAKYLRSIQPKTLILNGDIIDIWYFKKNYFPKTHLLVIKEITSLLSKGTHVHYIVGNHDEALRKFKGFTIGNFSLQNHLKINLPTGTAWFFHGDIFDYTMKYSKWLAKIAGEGYNWLILLNTFINWLSQLAGRGKISLSKKVKNSVKGVVNHVNKFEMAAAQLAVENKVDYVICGHIHQPEIRDINVGDKKITYLNSGDWVENSSALEYNENEWKLYYFEKDTQLIEEFVWDEIEKSLNYDFILEELLPELSKN